MIVSALHLAHQWWCANRDRRITQDIYDKKLNEYKEKQYDLNIQMEEYTKADENFHIVANTVLSLASRALEIFESSEANEKRQLLNFLLQNCRLSGTKLLFELKSPFDSIAQHAHQPSVLPLVDELRTLNWKEIAENLKYLIKTPLGSVLSVSSL